MNYACEVGEKIGKLTILRAWTASINNKKQKVCECQCECGKVLVLRASALRYDNKRCCGCEDRRGNRNLCLAGEKYGLLTIIRRWTEKQTTRKSKETFCECQCECGKVIITKGRYLRTNHKKSCGCLEHPSNCNHPLWKGYGAISGSFWAGIRDGAKRRGRIIPFEITIEEAWELFLKQKGKCALTGFEISFPLTDRRYGAMCSASLDRIDSAKGYTIDNVQWVHKDIQLMKMTLKQDIFIEWCRRVAHHS